jgi:four helix bundle protein
MIESFVDIKAWGKAHELVLEIYRLTSSFPKIEDYCLTSQIRRAAISVPSNIAEGFKRKSAKDSNHFYNIADGSLEEVKYQLILSKDLGYISIMEYENIFKLTEEVGKMLSGWKKSQA